MKVACMEFCGKLHATLFREFALSGGGRVSALSPHYHRHNLDFLGFFFISRHNRFLRFPSSLVRVQKNMQSPIRAFFLPELS
jgi:hypothetical protein